MDRTITVNEEDIKTILEENSRLRTLLEQHREREMADLRQRTMEAEAKVEHYRNEAQRNADTGRQIAFEYDRKLAELKAKIEAYERTATTRPGSTGR